MIQADGAEDGIGPIHPVDLLDLEVHARSPIYGEQDVAVDDGAVAGPAAHLTTRAGERSLVIGLAGASVINGRVVFAPGAIGLLAPAKTLGAPGSARADPTWRPGSEFLGRPSDAVSQPESLSCTAQADGTATDTVRFRR